jgi:hypothetical protein
MPPPFKNLPPIEERDGTRARQAAKDGADWPSVRSSCGHIYWFPPEAEHLAYGMDMSWTVVEERLLQALARRKRRQKGTGEPEKVHARTVLGAAVLALFAEKQGIKPNTTAADVATWGAEQGITPAEAPLTAGGTFAKLVASAVALKYPPPRGKGRR